MTHHGSPSDSSDAPATFRAIGFLAALTALASWSIAGGDSYADYLMVVVTGVIAAAISLPLILRRMRCNFDEDGSDESPASSSSGNGDLTTAIEALTPLAAVAFGMIAFGIAFRFAAG